jgi:DNA-binding response OmpR family regulator
MEEVRRPRGEARCFRRLAVDPAVREACIDGDARAMTSYQFAVLTTLVENAGRVRSREQLMDQVKEVQQEAFGRSIDVHLSRIGQAIEEDPRQPRRITTERGAGYVFAKAQQ